MLNLICLQCSAKLPVFVNNVSKTFFALPLKPKFVLSYSNWCFVYVTHGHAYLGWHESIFISEEICSVHHGDEN